MGADNWVVVGGAEGGHVKNPPHFESSALDAPAAMAAARVVSEWGNPDQGADRAPIETPQFGQGRDHRSAGDRTDALGRAQQGIKFGEVSFYMGNHLRLDVIELGLDRLDHGLDAGTYFGGGELQPQPLGAEHGQQLSAAGDQGRQFALMLIRQWLDEALQVITADEDRSEFGQCLSIDAVGLGQAAHGPGEVPGLLGVDDRDAQASGLQSTHQRRFVATGRFHDHQLRLQRRQCCRQRGMTVVIIAKSASIEGDALNGHIDARLGNVDAYNYG